MLGGGPPSSKLVLEGCETLGGHLYIGADDATPPQSPAKVLRKSTFLKCDRHRED